MIETECKRFKTNGFLTFTKLWVICMLCGIWVGVFAQPTQSQIDYAKSRIDSKPLLDTVCLAHILPCTQWTSYWYIIKKTTDTVSGEKFALLMGYRFLDMGNIYRFNETGTSTVYEGSSLQAKMKSEYPYQPAILRAIAVNPDLRGTVSKPKFPLEAGTAAGDAMFPPSYQEMYELNDNGTLIYSGTFLDKAYREMPIRRFWTRSPYTTPAQVWEIGFTLGTFVGTHVLSQIGMVGMVWVKYGGALHTIKGTVIGLANNANIPVYYTVNGVSSQVFTAFDSTYIIPDIPDGAKVVITASPQQGYTGSVLPLPSTDKVEDDIVGKDIIYCPNTTVPSITIQIKNN